MNQDIITGWEHYTITVMFLKLDWLLDECPVHHGQSVIKTSIYF